MSFEEQQRDELDALEAIYAEEYECKYFCCGLSSNWSSFLIVFNGFSNSTSLPRFAITIVSEEQEEDTELDNCKYEFCFYFQVFNFVYLQINWHCNLNSPKRTLM